MDGSSLNLAIQARQRALYEDGQLSKVEHKVLSLGVRYKWIYGKGRWSSRQHPQRDEE